MAQITDTDPYLLYLLVLAVYLPGLVAILFAPRLASFPVVTFTFAGMFLFTAAGSILIMTRPHFPLGILLSGEYVSMLILQALIFYLVAGPYVYLRTAPTGRRLVVVPADGLVCGLLLLATVIILGLYYLNVRHFVLFDLLAGRFNRVNILEYRAFTYGLPAFPFYRLGFLVFPAIAAALAILMAAAAGRVRPWHAAAVGLCLVPPLLLGEKAAILNISVVLLVAYTLHLAARGRTLADMLRIRAVLIILAAFIPTALIYLMYFNNPEDSVRAAFDQFVFRIIGVYSEALAAVVPYVKQHGYLGGLTMPNLKGLLPYDRISLEAVMQAFLSAGTEHASSSSLLGASPVPAPGEGYVNFGWPGFITFCIVSFACAIGVQEILLRLRAGATGLALSAWYGYLGFTLFTTTVFATLISLIHTVVAVGILVVWYLANRQMERRAS